MHLLSKMGSTLSVRSGNLLSGKLLQRTVAFGFAHAHSLGGTLLLESFGESTLWDLLSLSTDSRSAYAPALWEEATVGFCIEFILWESTVSDYRFWILSCVQSSFNLAHCSLCLPACSVWPRNAHRAHHARPTATTHGFRTPVVTPSRPNDSLVYEFSAPLQQY
jgi:hypothetical protein